RRKGRRMLDQYQVRPAQARQRAPEPEADAQGIEQPGGGVRRAGQLAADAEPQWRDAVDGNPRFVGDLARERRAFESDEVDVDPVTGQRLGVIAHPGTSAEISEGDDG